MLGIHIYRLLTLKVGQIYPTAYFIHTWWRLPCRPPAAYFFTPSIYIKSTILPALLTKQMLYVSYNLNFTPCFLLIRGTSGAPNLLISMVRGHTVAASAPGQVLSWSEEWKNKRRSGGKRREGEWRVRRGENMNYQCVVSKWKIIISWWLSDVWFRIVIINY